MKNSDMPAMPTFIAPSLDGGLHEGFHGLTKREELASRAMQGVLADSHIMNLIRCDDDTDTADMVAGLAVEYADALLEKLEEPQDE